MKVKNFEYNGFYGKDLEGYADYTAEFKCWTDDPGIARCECSDDIERLIPTFALEGFKVVDYHKQTYPNGKQIFGPPCKS